MAAHDARDRLPAIRCPTLVSVAEDDILVPPRFSREIAALVPGAELRVIPAAGHGYFLQQPEAFNSLALDFLARFHATIRRIVLRLERRPTSRTSNVAGQSGAG